jgi:hypothetical protein
MKCRIAAAARVASLNVADQRGLPKRSRRIHHALVKDLDEFVSIMLSYFPFAFTASTAIHGLQFSSELRGGG